MAGRVYVITYGGHAAARDRSVHRGQLLAADCAAIPSHWLSMLLRGVCALQLLLCAATNGEEHQGTRTGSGVDAGVEGGGARVAADTWEVRRSSIAAAAATWQSAALKTDDHSANAAAQEDWLVTAATPEPSYVRPSCWNYSRGPALCGIEIGNGLVARRFVTSPAFGTIDFIVNATARHGGRYSSAR